MMTFGFWVAMMFGGRDSPHYTNLEKYKIIFSPKPSQFSSISGVWDPQKFDKYLSL
jgi:hypothetical protein